MRMKAADPDSALIQIVQQPLVLLGLGNSARQCFDPARVQHGQHLAQNLGSGMGIAQGRVAQI